MFQYKKMQEMKKQRQDRKMCYLDRINARQTAADIKRKIIKSIRVPLWWNKLCLSFAIKQMETKPQN